MNNLTEEKSIDSALLLDTAMLAAVIILENGGETFRAEETAYRICVAAGKNETEVIALPTGIILSFNDDEGRKTSSLIRIKSRTYNLFRVERTNFFARNFENGSIGLDELNEKLSSLKNSIVTKKTFMCVAAGISSAMFTLLFEPALTISVVFDIFVTFIASFFIQYLRVGTRLKNAYQFTLTFISSMVIAFLAILLTKTFGIGNLDYIIIGAITPLLPGLSLTNAIRDTVTGDIISGTARLAETLLIAIAIAGGIGIVLMGYINITGGAL
ncbi:MAG: threonine/serine exporter family protein [Clostridia bacterium]|nr:threonine/serine exporter family protein [Clostridia bacterium]